MTTKTGCYFAVSYYNETIKGTVHDNENYACCYIKAFPPTLTIFVNTPDLAAVGKFVHVYRYNAVYVGLRFKLIT